MQYKNMEGTNMKKFVCQVCGYVYEGEAAPAKCPQCGAPASKFQEMAAEMGHHRHLHDRLRPGADGKDLGRL